MKGSIGRLTDLDEAKKIIIERLREAKEESRQGRVGFVSGIILSDGPLYVARNLVMLVRHTRLVRKNVGFPVFSAIDFIARLALIRLSSREYVSQKFWKEILQSGYVTDIFMTPRWGESNGAIKEYQVAKKLGIKINHVRAGNEKIRTLSSNQVQI